MQQLGKYVSSLGTVCNLFGGRGITLAENCYNYRFRKLNLLHLNFDVHNLLLLIMIILIIIQQTENTK